MSSASSPRGNLDLVRTAIAEHAFCRDLTPDHVVAMAEGARLATFPEGSMLFRRGMPATAFYLITGGSVALEIASPGHEPLTIETLHSGDALGWSWLFEGRGWQFDAHCTTDVTTIAIDAPRLRRLIADDSAFGRDLVLHVGRVVVDRLIQTRARLVDIHHHDHR